MENNENFNNSKKAAAAAADAELNETAETEQASVETRAELKIEPKKDEVDYKAKYFYAVAEMENYRKRMEREKENLLKYGNERILSELLPVLDNFERTMEMLRPDTDAKVKNIITGVDMVKKIFQDTLTKHGLTAVESIGKDFDPNFHEAVAQEYSEGKKPNEIIKEFQKGYILNGRLVRPAKVVVASDKQ